MTLPSRVIDALLNGTDECEGFVHPQFISCRPSVPTGSVHYMDKSLTLYGVMPVCELSLCVADGLPVHGWLCPVSVTLHEGSGAQ